MLPDYALGRVTAAAGDYRKNPSISQRPPLRQQAALARCTPYHSQSVGHVCNVTGQAKAKPSRLMVLICALAGLVTLQA
jgi:hypothetical protein